jgi:hypothetical protein
MPYLSNVLCDLALAVYDSSQEARIESNDVSGGCHVLTLEIGSSQSLFGIASSSCPVDLGCDLLVRRI